MKDIIKYILVILILSTNLYGKEKNMIIELKNGKVEIS